MWVAVCMVVPPMGDHQSACGSQPAGRSGVRLGWVGTPPPRAAPPATDILPGGASHLRVGQSALDIKGGAQPPPLMRPLQGETEAGPTGSQVGEGYQWRALACLSPTCPEQPHMHRCSTAQLNCQVPPLGSAGTKRLSPPGGSTARRHCAAGAGRGPDSASAWTGVSRGGSPAALGGRAQGEVGSGVSPTHTLEWRLWALEEPTGLFLGSCWPCFLFGS